MGVGGGGVSFHFTVWTFILSQDRVPIVYPYKQKSCNAFVGIWGQYTC